MKNHMWKIFGVVAVLLLVGSFVYSNNAANEANEGIVFSEHVKGNPEAAVVLAKYSDFQCPACAQAAPVVDDILSQYGEQIRFEYNHFPLITIHPSAVTAARAAEAAGQQGKFFAMHDKIFENQRVWSNAASPNVYFEQYAEEIGLDMGLYKRHLNASVIDDKIMEEFRTAQQLGFTGTPTFTLNGERIQFASYADLISLIEAALGIQSEETVVTEPAVEFGI